MRLTLSTGAAAVTVGAVREEYKGMFLFSSLTICYTVVVSLPFLYGR